MGASLHGGFQIVSPAQVGPGRSWQPCSTGSLTIPFARWFPSRFAPRHLFQQTDGPTTGLNHQTSGFWCNSNGWVLMV